MKYLKKIGELDKINVQTVREKFLEDSNIIFNWIENGKLDLDSGGLYDFLFRLCIKYNRLDDLKKLVQLGENRIQKSNIPFIIASENKNWDIFDYLLSIDIKFDIIRVFMWISNTPKLNYQERVDIMEKLQSYIDSKKVEIDMDQMIPVTIGKRDKCSVSDIISKFNTIKNWAINSINE